MNVDKIYSDCQALKMLIPRINEREQGAINELNRLYVALFGERVRATCSNCHIKAVHRLTTLTINDIKIMNNQNFKLKKGQLINWPFRSSQFFTAAGGISDATAIEYIQADPRRLEKFASYPGSDTESKKLDLTLIGIDPEAPVIAPPVTPEFVVIDTFGKVKEKYNIVISDNLLSDIHTLKMISNENSLDMSDEELKLVDDELDALKKEQESFEIETVKSYEINGEVMSIETMEKILDEHSSEFTQSRIDLIQKIILSLKPDTKEPIKTDVPAAKPLNRMNKAELSAEYEKEFLTAPPEEMTVKQLLKKLTNK